MRKYAKTHEPVTWEDRLGRDVPLSEVSLPFRARVQAFSKKCGVFRALRCFLIGLVGLIRWCLRYQAIFIVFDSVRRHKNSDYSKKALKLMREYAKINEFGVAERRTGLLFLVHSQSTQTPRGVCLWVACWHQWKIAHGTNNPNRSDVTCTTVPTDFPQRPVCVHYSPHKGDQNMQEPYLQRRTNMWNMTKSATSDPGRSTKQGRTIQETSLYLLLKNDELIIM